MTKSEIAKDDLDTRLDILKRGLKVEYHKRNLPPIKEAVFSGQAEDYDKFNSPDFQRFMEENNINPGEEIVIWEKEPDVFRVVRKSEIRR